VDINGKGRIQVRGVAVGGEECGVAVVRNEEWTVIGIGRATNAQRDTTLLERRLAQGS
jgi:hypothetical protein